MIAALKGLAQESWVIGIACAAALAYAVITFTESLIRIPLVIVDGTPAPSRSAGSDIPEEFFDFPYTSVINGKLVSFEPLIQHSILLVLVVAGVAILLRATGSRDEATPGGDS